MEKNIKSFGWGSFSLILFIFSTIVLFLTVNKKLIGEHIVDYFNVNIHEVSISIVLLVIAITLGWKFPKDLLSRAGLTASVIFLGLLILLFTIDLLKTIF
ncbi:hypothetical protein ACFFGV_15325 [Pontibacillus salicampi]|uniref:Uncharacterized protein n=1 Tax=Pontibacillus salicampi TaxID=1449801 RepID=A0ABV6LRB3_9BACI